MRCPGWTARGCERQDFWAIWTCVPSIKRNKSPHSAQSRTLPHRRTLVLTHHDLALRNMMDAAGVEWLIGWDLAALFSVSTAPPFTFHTKGLIFLRGCDGRLPCGWLAASSGKQGSQHYSEQVSAIVFRKAGQQLKLSARSIRACPDCHGALSA